MFVEWLYPFMLLYNNCISQLLLVRGVLTAFHPKFKYSTYLQASEVTQVGPQLFLSSWRYRTYAHDSGSFCLLSDIVVCFIPMPASSVWFLAHTTAWEGLTAVGLCWQLQENLCLCAGPLSASRRGAKGSHLWFCLPPLAEGHHHNSLLHSLPHQDPITLTPDSLCAGGSRANMFAGSLNAPKPGSSHAKAELLHYL